jgi:S1-C subfamily serine protease
MNKSQKSIIFWLTVLLVGAIAGVLGSQVLSPWLAALPLAEKINWPGKAKETTTIINKTEKIYLTEDLVYQESIGRVLNSVVYLRAEKAGKKLAESVGFILTSDGLAVAGNLAAVKGATDFILTREGKEYPAQLSKEDKDNGLALFKIAENNLPVISFGDASNLKLGERVFLPGANVINGISAKFVLAGFIKSVSPVISLGLSEKLILAGEPIINSQGDVLGIALADKDGNVKLAEAEKIRGLMK